MPPGDLQVVVHVQYTVLRMCHIDLSGQATSGARELVQMIDGEGRPSVQSYCAQRYGKLKLPFLSRIALPTVHALEAREVLHCYCSTCAV